MDAIGRSVLVLTFLAGAASATPGAEGPSENHGPQVDEALGFSINKLGLQHSLDLRWTRSLTSSTHPLLADAHVAAGLSHVLTPSYTRLAAWVEVAPLSILELRAGAEPAAYFGTFSSLLSFDGYQDRFDDDTLKARKHEAKSGTGSRLYAGSTLKLRLGPLVAASSADLEWWRSSAAGPFYYEPARDTLFRVDGDRMLAMSTVLLRPFDLGPRGKVSFGVVHSLAYVFDAPDNQSQRIGVVVLRQFGARRFGLHAPKIGGQLGWYLRDPYRKGQLSLAVGVTTRLAR
jgi:hypothetical protein